MVSLATLAHHLSQTLAELSQWMSSMTNKLVSLLVMLRTIAQSVCAPSEQGSAYKQYPGLFSMIEQKLEWIGSKCDQIEKTLDD